LPIAQASGSRTVYGFGGRCGRTRSACRTGLPDLMHP